MISRVTQFVVPLANKPGTLSKLCSVLGDAQVNIIGIFAPEAKGTGKARIMVVDAVGTRAALKKAKIPFSEEDALNVELDNEPGAFGELAGKLAQKGINIRYAYVTTGPFARARVVIAVSDIDKAIVALKPRNVWNLNPRK